MAGWTGFGFDGSGTDSQNVGDGAGRDEFQPYHAEGAEGRSHPGERSNL